jgi:hypothetical protein
MHQWLNLFQEHTCVAMMSRQLYSSLQWQFIHAVVLGTILCARARRDGEGLSPFEESGNRHAQDRRSYFRPPGNERRNGRLLVDLIAVGLDHRDGLDVCGR